MIGCFESTWACWSDSVVDSTKWNSHIRTALLGPLGPLIAPWCGCYIIFLFSLLWHFVDSQTIYRRHLWFALRFKYKNKLLIYRLNKRAEPNTNQSFMQAFYVDVQPISHSTSIEGMAEINLRGSSWRLMITMWFVRRPVQLQEQRKWGSWSASNWHDYPSTIFSNRN